MWQTSQMYRKTTRVVGRPLYNDPRVLAVWRESQDGNITGVEGFLKSAVQSVLNARRRWHAVR